MFGSRGPLDILACVWVATPAGHQHGATASRQIRRHGLAEAAVGTGDKAYLAVDA
ncbi:MAG: hypothetical protein OXG82_02640 [Gammaproteobacteria bacterium]|nr:hypothetical protein [Gammaproteobacteria bacterium]